MNSDNPRARVFISCGQSKDSGERETAAAIARKLESLGFEPWIAVEEQTLNGIKEHIFETLSNSEYFIFVDFKRERFVEIDDHRGSLFSHQELAVASYLGVEVLALQESGVRREGLLASIGANAASFDDRKTLPDKIEDEVKGRLKAGKWNSRWRNEIVLESPTTPEDVPSKTPGVNRRFFHIIVRNRHRHRAATNCYAYLQRATNLDSSETKSYPMFELKWEGYVLPYVNIPPENYRRFDGFFISPESPTQLHFSRMFSDRGTIVPSLQGAGHYELNYLVLSNDFPPARRSYFLTLGHTIDSTTLVPAT